MAYKLLDEPIDNGVDDGYCSCPSFVYCQPFNPKNPVSDSNCTVGLQKKTKSPSPSIMVP